MVRRQISALKIVRSSRTWVVSFTCCIQVIFSFWTFSQSIIDSPVEDKVAGGCLPPDSRDLSSFPTLFFLSHRSLSVRFPAWYHSQIVALIGTKFLDCQWPRRAVLYADIRILPEHSVYGVNCWMPKLFEEPPTYT